MLGNPVTDTHDDVNSRIQYAHRRGVISDEYYEVILPLFLSFYHASYMFENVEVINLKYMFVLLQGAKSSCQGEYVDLDPNNAQCIYYLRLIEEIRDTHLGFERFTLILQALRM